MDEMRRLKVLDYMLTASEHWTPEGQGYLQCHSGGPVPDEPAATTAALYADMERVPDDEIARLYAYNPEAIRCVQYVPSEMCTFNPHSTQELSVAVRPGIVLYTPPQASKTVLSRRNLTGEAMEQSLRCEEFEAVRQLTFSPDGIRSIITDKCSIDKLPAMSQGDFLSLHAWAAVGKVTASPEMSPLLNEYWVNLNQSKDLFGKCTPTILTTQALVEVDLSSSTQHASFVAEYAISLGQDPEVKRSEPETAKVTRVTGQAMNYFQKERKQTSTRLRDLYKKQRVSKTRIHELEAKNRVLKTKIHELEAENHALKNKIHELEAENHALKNKIHELEAKIHALEANATASTAAESQEHIPCIKRRRMTGNTDSLGTCEVASESADKQEPRLDVARLPMGHGSGESQKGARTVPAISIFGKVCR